MILGISTGTMVVSQVEFSICSNHAIYQILLSCAAALSSRATGTSELDRLGVLGKKNVAYLYCLSNCCFEHFRDTALLTVLSPNGWFIRVLIEMGNTQTLPACTIRPVWLLQRFWKRSYTCIIRKSHFIRFSFQDSQAI